jgi:hypothetical protein
VATSPPNINTTTGFLNITGAKPIGPTQFSPKAQLIAQEWSALTPNQPTSTQMHAELAATQSRSGFWPKFASIGSRALGAAGSFVLGWQVGTEIRHTLMPENPGGGALPITSYRFRDKGDCLTGSAVVDPLHASNCGPSGPLLARGGEVQYLNNNSGAASIRWSPWSQVQETPNSLYMGPPARCSNLPTEAPSESAVRVFWATDYGPQPGGLCRGQYNTYAIITSEQPLAWWPGAGGATPANTVTTSMPYPGQASSVPAAEAAAQEALDSGEYRALAPWLDYATDPEHFANPTTPTNENHKCDLSDPGYMDPGFDIAGASWNVHEGPFAATGRPPDAPEASSPVLRVGNATWNGTFRDDWDGWGWRHIKAKHGWSPADSAATQEALLVPGVSETSTNMIHWGPEYAQNGAVCQRKVVVEYGMHAGDPPETPKGIITSFGKFIRDAP